jgi:hypothetical protein
MSLRGFRILPHVSHGGRYKLGADLVPVSTSTGAAPVPPFTWDGFIWALGSVWSTGSH